MKLEKQKDYKNEVKVEEKDSLVDENTAVLTCPLPQQSVNE